MTRLDSTTLAPLMSRHLARAGAGEDAVSHVVGSLVQTSLRGVDSHGIHLFPHYVQAVRAGRVNAAPRFTTTGSGTSSAVLDADHAFGHHAGALAIDLAVDMARTSGLAAVCVRNSTHFGAAAYFALRAAENGMIGFAFTNADALVKAFNGRRSIFGTNPVCVAAPLETEAPLCLDMATSLVSWNKIRSSRASGQRIPMDWGFEENGQPTDDPTSVVSLNPAGGYKGFGLGMIVEVLCGVLAGGPVATEILPMFTTPMEKRRSISHFFMALDVAHFIELGAFKARLQRMVALARESPPLSGRVMVPGDPEKQALVERLALGIPIPDPAFAALREVSEEFAGATLP